MTGLGTGKPDFKFVTLYLNARRLTELVGPDAVKNALGNLQGAGMNDKLIESVRVGALGRVLRDWLWANRSAVPRLEPQVLAGALKPHALFFTERDFYCKDVPPRWGEPPRVGRITAKYPLSGGDVQLELVTHSDHVAPGSAGEMLTGHPSDIFVIGHTTEVSPGSINGNLVFAGQILDVKSPEVMLAYGPWHNHVFVEQINQFEKCQGEKHPRDSELKQLQTIPENDIKHAFAKLLDEDGVPKDWAGERADLFSTHALIEGKRATVSFAFKGPAKFHMMQLADLGKNGDQIDRLFTEPSDLLVLQHCHRISAAVRNTMKAYANQIGNQRRYCIIDGGDTLRVLRAYGLCGQTSKPLPPPAQDDDVEPE